MQTFNRELGELATTSKDVNDARLRHLEAQDKYDNRCFQVLAKVRGDWALAKPIWKILVLCVTMRTHYKTFPNEPP